MYTNKFKIMYHKNARGIFASNPIYFYSPRTRRFEHTMSTTSIRGRSPKLTKVRRKRAKYLITRPPLPRSHPAVPTEQRFIIPPLFLGRIPVFIHLFVCSRVNDPRTTLRLLLYISSPCNFFIESRGGRGEPQRRYLPTAGVRRLSFHFCSYQRGI